MQSKNTKKQTIARSSSISFADIAHQTVIFDEQSPSARLVLKLIDTSWVQRLREIRQTGNTHLVYMYSEHSRFGHSLGVAYLALTLLEHLRRFSPKAVKEHESAVLAAALLHDIGHVAPGSHLAERIWAPQQKKSHECATQKIIQADPEIRGILEEAQSGLTEQVCAVLAEDAGVPAWTWAIISGGGWNADRGNWSIVDSAMASVSYGRYNVAALIDAFRLTADGRLVLLESRLDALTHFFLARDSMYRQVYQHRVLQAADALTGNIVLRLRDIIAESGGTLTVPAVQRLLGEREIFADETMCRALLSKNYVDDLPLESLFSMTEPWWYYHLARWSGNSTDTILRDLAGRLHNRRLFKTVRLFSGDYQASASPEQTGLPARAKAICEKLGFDPRYYLVEVNEADKHRIKDEEPPLVLLDDGSMVSATTIEPLIAKLSERTHSERSWLAVPSEVKRELGLPR